MSTAIEWDNDEQTAIRVEFDDDWSWDDFRTTHDEAHAQIAQVDHRVDLIVWFKSRPPAESAYEHLVYTGSNQPPNTRHTVMINDSRKFIEMIVDVVDNRQGWVGATFVSTLDEARVYLAERDD